MQGDFPEKNQTLSPPTVKRILRAVDNGLESFGKNVKEVFYSELESAQDLKRSEIVYNPEEFEKILSRFFMAGTPLVERSIGKEILKEFELPPSSGVNFRTAIEIVKRHPRSEQGDEPKVEVPREKPAIFERPTVAKPTFLPEEVSPDFEKNPDW